MALFVETKYGKTLIEWHVGGEKLGDIVGEPEFVVSVQADGDELAVINDEIQGVRKAYKKRVVRWSGEDARFIAENL